MMAGLKRHWGVAREAIRHETAQKLAGIRAANDMDETAFLPAALEILHTPPNPLGRIILWVLIGFLTIALAWACLGSVDVVAAAQGKVAPRGRIKVIQAADQGVVRAIHIREGQAVVQGEPLIELDPTVSGADVQQARQALLSARIDVARARALVDYALGRGPGRFVAPEGADPDIVALQVALVRAKINENRTAIASLGQERAQHGGEYQMVAAESVKLDQQLPLAESQLTSLKALLARGYAAKMKVDEVEERVIGLRQDLAIRKAELGKAAAASGAVDQQIGKARSEFAREALDALTEAEAARALREEELKKAKDKASMTVLTAPETGVVQQLQVNTLGGVVKPADPLLIIVPKGGELIIEARLLNRDAGFVREGQAVEIKLEAFPFTKYGVLEGRVEHVSRDAIEDEKDGLVFPAIVRITKPWLKVGDRKAFVAPGLAATAEIKTGRRRIIEYLLSPLARRMREAGREM